MDNCLFTSFYKKCYKDLSGMSDKDVKKHWETIGKKEGRLPNKILFDEKYPNFNIREWVKTNDKYVFTNTYEMYGWVYMEDKKNYKKYLKSNGYVLSSKLSEGQKIKLNSNIKFEISNEIIDLNEIIRKFNIRKLSVSKALGHFEERFLNKYYLEKYDNKKDLDESTIFFGIYDQNDFKKILDHNGMKFLVWGGTDCDDRYKIRKNSMYVIKKVTNLHHIAISECIKERLDKYSIPNQQVNFSLVDSKIFCPVDILGNSIYIYNGFTNGNEYIYGENVYKKVVEALPQFDFIYSNKLNKSWTEMPEIYAECFIGLRLTDGDGNANTVQEFNSMDIPIIFNGPGGISWKDHQDIVETIENQFEKKCDYVNKILNIEKI
jgi:hypothetical protein